MKHKLLLAVLVLVQLSSGQAVADDATAHSMTHAQKGIFIVNVAQEPETEQLVVSELSPCAIQETKFICGQYAAETWLTGKTVYINPARIISIYAFSSEDEYKTAVKKLGEYKRAVNKSNAESAGTPHRSNSN